MTGVLDQEQAAQRLEGERRNREEVQCDNRFPVIVQKRQPPFARITAPSDAPQYRATVRSEATKPSFCSSPWILGGRGRDSGYPLPPAQTRAGAIDAHGSYLGCVAAKRTLG